VVAASHVHGTSRSITLRRLCPQKLPQQSPIGAAAKAQERHFAPQQFAPLFDDLVGERQKIYRQFDACDFYGLEAEPTGKGRIPQPLN
jgi:hypothetical protein